MPNAYQALANGASSFTDITVAEILSFLPKLYPFYNLFFFRQKKRMKYCITLSILKRLHFMVDKTRSSRWNNLRLEKWTRKSRWVNIAVCLERDCENAGMEYFFFVKNKALNSVFIKWNVLCIGNQKSKPFLFITVVVSSFAILNTFFLISAFINLFTWKHLFFSLPHSFVFCSVIKFSDKLCS